MSVQFGFRRLLCICLFFNSFCGGQAQSFAKSYQQLHSRSYVQDKNFYLLTLFEKIKAVEAVLQSNPIIRQIRNAKFEELKKTARCKEDIPCQVSGYLWSPAEIAGIGGALKSLAATSNVFKALVQKHLRPCSYYIIYDATDDGTLLQNAWTEAANGINGIISTYAMGVKPLYPAIDSASYDVHSKMYARLIDIISLQIQESPEGKSFYQPSLQFALNLLEVNNRDEAARFEPLEQTENKAAVQYIKTINWAKFRYSIILVPGAGNDLPNVGLAAWGKMRLKIAVDRYKKGLAPLIIVSGGYVHPFQTPYCEALEMKKYLMSFYRIPDKAILIEPHARHTTTNIRNAGRLFFRYGIPVNRDALLVTDQNQSLYVEDKKFEERCIKEMKCVPFIFLKRTSIYDLVFRPNITSLYSYSMDPLDP